MKSAEDAAAKEEDTTFFNKGPSSLLSGAVLPQDSPANPCSWFSAGLAEEESEETSEGGVNRHTHTQLWIRLKVKVTFCYFILQTGTTFYKVSGQQSPENQDAVCSFSPETVFFCFLC